MDTVYKATAEALGEMQFKIISQRKGKTSASFHAQELRGRSITVELLAKSPAVTKTNIRVGLMGDQVMSRLIMGEIQARCPATPDTANPPMGPSGPNLEPARPIPSFSAGPR